MGKRAQFVTKTGVIAATVGSAVGLGNIWRFPYEAGVHGGGAFMIIYILCVFVLGIPVMLSEFVIGRSTHKNPKGAITQLSPGSPFRFVSYMGIAAALMILSFYSVVAGWIMEYMYESVVELFSSAHIAPSEYAEKFSVFITNPWRPLLWVIVFLVLNKLVLNRGIEKGIEKISNILMPVLFLILIIFCINSLTLDKAAEGLSFLFNPDFSQLSPSVVIGAMGQAFFSLSLGLTCMMTYSSYFSDDTPLVRSATTIAVLDTFVAILSGIVIFPAVFSYGMNPEAGPKLVFEILPAIFSQMPGGHIWSVAFFVLLFFASITSTISMSEIAISFFIEERKMTRARATNITVGIALVFGLLCALSFGPLSGVTVFGLTIFNLFDYISSNICLPVGGFMLSVFVGWVLQERVVRDQLTNGGSLRSRMVGPVRFCIRYIAPTCILIIFLYGLLHS